MWKSSIEGRALRFRLFGINNQNFLMRDEETGSWWQQVTGEAIHGPLAGKSLEPVPWDEVTFAVWRAEHPGSRVLSPDEETQEHYASPEWAEEVAKLPVPATADSSGGLLPRSLVVGVRADGEATAFPWTLFAAGPLIEHVVGATPVALVLHPDGRSLRCFDRRVDGRVLSFALEPGANPPVLVDGETGSRWDFSGRATTGPLAGGRLTPVRFLKEYWFDWKAYNPRTAIHEEIAVP